MIPAAFRYERAQSVEDAVKRLSRHGGEAKLLAGGHSLLPLMKLRLARPGVLVDIGHLVELEGIQEGPQGFRIGALTTHAAVAAHQGLAQAWPVWHEAAAGIGDLQVRNRGTVGGNLAHADPASDLPGVALATGAQLGITGPGGPQVVPVDAFFVGPFQTALGEDQVLTHVLLPAPPPRTGSAYRKFSHPASGYAVAGVAAVLTLAEDGTVSQVRVGMNGVALWAYEATEVENMLRGEKPSQALLAEAAQRVTDGQEVQGDSFASTDYRRHLARHMAQEALMAAWKRAQLPA
jgi:carbon-monoxide dehydrogenase medium subunit